MLSVFISNRLRASKHQAGMIGFLSKSSTLGVMLGVAVLIVALSVINGFEQQLKTRLLSVVPHVAYQAPYDPISNWPDKVRLLEAQQGIVAAAPEISLTAMVQFRGELKAAQVKGVDFLSHHKVSDVSQFITDTSLSEMTDNDIILGRHIATELGLKRGDKVTLLVANSQAASPLAAPKRLNFVLADVINMGGPIDRSLALVSVKRLQQAMGLSDDEVTGLRAKVEDVFSAHQVAMVAGRALPDLVYVNSWFRTQGSLYQDIQMVRTIVYLVVFLIIAVASFNIVSSMVMEVKEKQSDIAILKTMGTRDSTIFATFAIQGVSYALIGALVGLFVGILLALNISDLFRAWIELDGDNPLQGVYFIEFLPSQLDWLDVVSVLSITLVISVLSCLYPAWQAVKVDPARVLGG